MSSSEPYLSIVRGDATPEETAALVAALAARAAARGARPTPPPATGNWSNPAHRLRPGLPHGPGAWRRAFFPGG
ncbi:acyl-CoA carboxylase subunit epsilon [Microbispora sp. H10836]|uniref:acyl-CoA carboxylase subunit epsilon n=1 Tax=Microbispora sp. H10836 TaxID=2729106 RepID=UPI001474B151|nr:acyl-CoA carboxylase subunit epsilon [Microbispora sp. H10836]